MSKRRRQRPEPPGDSPPPFTFPRSSLRMGMVSVFCLLVAIGAAFLAKRYSDRSPMGETNEPATLGTSTSAVPSATVEAPAPQPTTNSLPALPTLEVNQALMVTVELDCGPQIPTIADALKEVERRHQPADGVGRTFAVLDAYGGPAADGRKLHMSMHVSAEKPGIGALVFRRTGEVLWQSRIVPGTNTAAFTGKNLTILIADGAGNAQMVDGSGNPPSLLEARMRDGGILVRDFWPDSAEREVTFLYSACGCPVKVMARREGERTVRTKELPVIFPDDSAVLQVIGRLTGW